MRRTIEAKTEIVCDVCGAIEPHHHNGCLTVKRDYLGAHNISIADGAVNRDLCDNCLERIEKAINAEAELIRQGKTACAVEIVFDGPPNHESGRFVEVEEAGKEGKGRSVGAGEWRQRSDGYWVLGPFRVEL